MILLNLKFKLEKFKNPLVLLTYFDFNYKNKNKTVMETESIYNLIPKEFVPP